MKRIRTLDTHEQKSPRFLIDAFDDLLIAPMAVGDYFSGPIIDKHYKYGEVDHIIGIEGNLVEIKIGKDFGIHTEQLERFQDECYRMSCYRQKNPDVQLHAVWRAPEGGASLNDVKLFNNICFKYHIWGHVVWTDEQLIQFLQDLDQPSKYKEFEPYIKRSHEEPTDLAKALRVPKGSASDFAIQLSQCETKADFANIPSLFKKDGSHSKLWHKMRDYLNKLWNFYLLPGWRLETGVEPK